MARKMKDSGIEWIGEIPEGWEITKIKHIVSSVTDTDHFMPDSAEFGIPYLMIGDLKDLSSSIDWDSSKKISIEDYKKLSIKSRPQIGDIIFARYASIGTTCYIDTDRDFLVSYACLTIHPSDLIIGKFLSYYLKSSSFAEDVLRRTNSNTQGNVGKDSLVNATIVLPSIIEQTQIVNFLDAKCSDINAMLSKTRSSIEEYKKLKQAVITQAVTKGVRGEREMKDSGVEWVSYIPVDWNTIKLKYCTYIRARLGWRALKADEYVESGFPFLSAFNIVNNALHFTNLNYINQFRYDESPEIRLKVGDVLLVKDGAGIGKCAIVENMPIPSTVNGSISVISSTSFITPKYLYYYFLSEMFQQHIDLLKDGMGVPHLFQSDLKEIKIAFPSKDEQKEIADCLDAKCAEIDGLIAKKEQLAKELESYRKSLIYEVVTGKREV